MQRSQVGQLIYDALQFHAEWRVRVKQAIRNASIGGNREQLVADEYCALGKWLAEDIEPQLQGDAEYAVVADAHQRFHRELAEIASAIRHGDTAAACEMIAAGSEFAELSSTMNRELTRWLAKIEILGRKTQAA